MLELWAAVIILAILLFTVMVAVRDRFRDLEKRLALAQENMESLQTQLSMSLDRIECLSGNHDYDIFKTDNNSVVKKQCGHCYYTIYLNVSEVKK